MTRYPLSWPVGWKRTESRSRQRAEFRRTMKAWNETTKATVSAGTRPLTVYDAIQRLTGELDRLGAVDPMLSTNVQVRMDGMPRSGLPEPGDPGAAVYFTLRKRDTVLACDRWIRVADNIAAIAQHIDALRRIDRYGVGSLEQAFAGYAALPEMTIGSWRNVLKGTTLEEVEMSYRALSRRHHPDAGGTDEAMGRLNVAIAEARKELT